MVLAIFALKKIRSAALVLQLFACGKVQFGADRAPADTGQAALPDAAAPKDATPEDTGELERDVGVACVEHATPEFPVAWPFARTRAAYESEFHVWAAEGGCAVGLCHGDQGANPPFIPRVAADMDDAVKLELAINQLWESAPPRVHDGESEAVSHLVWVHRRGNALQSNEYEPAQTAYLEALVSKGSVCGWKPIVAARDAHRGPGCWGPSPAAGPDAGSSDAGSSDAGALDGGPVDAAPATDAAPSDARPVDAGSWPDATLDVGPTPDARPDAAVERACYCPLPTVEVAACTGT
ncbi:MAG: hypothetical protein HYV07_17625 [Deltaproteobacteria bacterium]|nr:hypothetical protein [Deltaproteobacteria bacterium]